MPISVKTETHDDMAMEQDSVTEDRVSSCFDVRFRVAKIKAGMQRIISIGLLKDHHHSSAIAEEFPSISGCTVSTLVSTGTITDSVSTDSVGADTNTSFLSGGTVSILG